MILKLECWGGRLNLIPAVLSFVSAYQIDHKLHPTWLPFILGYAYFAFVH